MKRYRKGKLWAVIIFGVSLMILSISVTNYFVLLESKKRDDAITIGYCIDNLVIERWQRDQEIFRAKALEEGIEVIVYNANEDNETQREQIKLLIEKRVDVIVIIPYDKDGLADVLAEASKEGIKVLAYDRLVNNAPIDAYISFDNVKVGELQARALIEKVPKGNYVIINGSPDDHNSYMFHQGYLNVLNPYISGGEVTVLAEIWAEDWREEPAYDLISSLIEDGKEIDAIIAANDRLAEAAIRALAEAGLAGNVYVAGHDADISACQRIVEGTQYMTVYKPIKLLAEAAVALAIDLALERDVTTEERIYNQVLEVPFVKLDVIAVTKDNMEETIIEDGFHKKEDVYRNH